MISHAVITAFLARMPDAQPTLAAYSIAFYFHATLGSPVWAIQFVAMSYAKDRAAVRRLGIFGLQAAGVCGWLWLLVAFTPAGDLLFMRLYGASAPVSEAAQRCVFVLVLMLPLVIVRSIAYALIMLARHTLLITCGTLLRLGGLLVILWALSARIEGAVVGAFGLVGCIAVETLFAVLFARRYYRALAVSAEPLPSYGDLWRFGWPIMLMHGMENGVAFTMNFFLGRLPRPELALAGFGVLDSIVRVLLGPLRNLVHTAQALVHTRTDMRMLTGFAAQVGLIFAGGMLLLNLGLVRDAVLGGIMGLSPEIAAYVTPALGVSCLLAAGMAAAGLARGLLIASRHTAAIALSAALRLLAVGAVGGAGLALGVENGATMGMAALIAAFAAEALWLGVRLVRLHRRLPGLFASDGEDGVR